ncbi:MAG: sensor histidine kinase, partial [Rubrobacteraceae bacterium]
ALAYAVLRVVAELRRLYARQRALSEELARASRAKSDFLADVSHEIRTPLTVIRGNAETGLAIQRDCAHGEILEEIARETRKTSRMVGDLLFLARSDSAEPPLEKENVATELFLAELSGRAAILARERGATLEIEHEGCEWVRIDPTRVEQSVLILIDNAAKYGGAPITLTSRNTSGELIIEVSDDGPGIPEEKLPHIFERFYRADRTRRRNGAGLGLPIAKTIIEAHGGRIEVESEVGEGTTMSLYLPLMDDEDPANHLTASNTERSPD